MGLLVDGVWQDKWYDTKKSGGRFQRTQSEFRNWITPDGSPGPSGEGGFAAEPGRYHLYVSYACPWAHRTLIFRALKGLEDMIDISVVHWVMGENGWTFKPDDEGIVGDKLFDSDYLYEVYLRVAPDMTGRVTVPILWDKKQGTIVSNESSEIIRMLNSAFDDVGAKPGDYYPEDKREEIDSLNDRIYETVNNGVYKSGFATTQEAYEEAVYPLFETLDFLEERLASQRFLTGDSPLEADWRLFPTLMRFDTIYHGHFKCNIRRLVDYDNLWNYTRDLYQMPGIAETINLTHAKRHYHESHETINPHGIVPAGPILDFSAPHNRDAL
jgi:putative glutathione S-transferase